MPLYSTKLAVKSCIYAHVFQATVIYTSDLFTYNAEYFQTLSGEKWRSLASSLHSMLAVTSLHTA